MSATRRRLHFWILIPVLIVLMTWPTFYYVLDGDTFWIPSRGHDVWYELWEGWYGGQILRGRAELFYTNLLFYPQGVSLIYHQHTVPHMLLYQGLRGLLPMSAAYNLAFLLTLLANALATYVCASLFTKDRWISLFAAAFIGICVTLRFKTDAQFWTYYTIPLSVYCLHRAITEKRRLYAILCGALVGLTVYIGFYVLICLALTVGIYGLYLAWTRWRQPEFWTLALLAAAVCAAISLPRLAPMLADSDQVATVLEFRSYWDRASNDLLDFVAHPVFADENPQQAYLGYIPLALACLALARWHHRRKLFHWLLILVVFVVLRLGTFLTINGTEYRDILLPKHYLNHWFPELFRGFAGGHHWVLGALLPLAILACYGLRIALRSASDRRKAFVVLILIGFVALEHYHRPMFHRIVTKESVAFLDWLETEDDDDIRVIHVPMSTTFMRRYYNFLQALSGYPQVEGSVNRLLPEAYAYIHDNYVLSAWKAGRAIHCLPSNQRDFEAAVDQLAADGFTHVVYHPGANRLEGHSFASVPAAYADDFASVFRVGDLRQSCANALIKSPDTPAHLRALAFSVDLKPDLDVTVLSLQPARRLDETLFAYLESVFDDWDDYVHVYAEDGRAAVQSHKSIYDSLDAVLTHSQMILLLTAPDQDDSAAVEALRARLDADYQTCGRAIETDDATGEFFIAAAYPCAIMLAEDGRRVVYADAPTLENAALELGDRDLDLFLYWKNRRQRAGSHAYSVQVFDAAGGKARQADYVIGHQPLAHHRLDLSGLSPGDYAAQLIVYDFDTGASVSGIVAGSGKAIERQLELARFRIE